MANAYSPSGLIRQEREAFLPRLAHSNLLHLLHLVVVEVLDKVLFHAILVPIYPMPAPAPPPASVFPTASVAAPSAYGGVPAYTPPPSHPSGLAGPPSVEVGMVYPAPVAQNPSASVYPPS